MATVGQAVNNSMDLLRKFIEEQVASAKRSAKYYDEERIKAEEKAKQFDAVLSGLDVAIELNKIASTFESNAAMMEALAKKATPTPAVVDKVQTWKQTELQVADENKAAAETTLTSAEVKTLLQPELETA